MRRENIKWDWQPNGDLSLWNVGDAVIKHPRTNEEIFFNQATASHCSYYKTMPMVCNILKMFCYRIMCNKGQFLQVWISFLALSVQGNRKMLRSVLSGVYEKA